MRKTKRRKLILTNLMFWKSHAGYIKNYRPITRKFFLNWRKSGIRRPNREGRNRLT